MPETDLFVDDWLLEQRRGQRRTLGYVPTWMLERLSLGRFREQLGVPAAVDVEIQLRMAAKVTADEPNLSQFLARARRNASALESHDFLKRRGVQEPSIDLTPFADLLRRWTAERDETDVSNLPLPLSVPLARLVQLLVWADDLAGDYADPRLTATA